MEKIKIDNNWKFKDIINNLTFIKGDYIRILSSFLWFDCKNKNNFVSNTKKYIYSLSIQEWQQDKIWEYLNDNIELEELNKYL